MNLCDVRIYNEGVKLNRYSENTLTPIKISGVIIPSVKTLAAGQVSDYKVVCSSGLEYFIIANSEWRKILSCYRREEVKIVGLLNSSDMSIIPQKIFPKGPSWDRRDFVRELVKKGNDLGLIPAAARQLAAAVMHL